MKRILSFGGGLQTTALAILVSTGKLQVDEVIFSDTGGEKAETYWFIEHYIKPILKVPFITVKSHLGTLYDHCYEKRIIPSVINRWCSDKFKIRPIEKHYKGVERVMLVGFSTDEIQRTDRPSRQTREFPLIERGLSATDCVHIIQDYGFPVPLRSSCYFCVYQPLPEYNWLKIHHPELVKKAVELERNSYIRYPHLRETYGLLRGTPLWKWAAGIQTEFIFSNERSCWSGDCGH